MTLYDILENWEDIKPQKKRQALQKIVDFIDYQDGDHDSLIFHMIMAASAFEGDDYFGTEGLVV